MYRYRHTERSACLPHRIESPIIDPHERTLRDSLPQVETERLQYLEPARPCLLRTLDCISLDLAVVGAVTLIPQGLGESQKPVRMRLLKFFNRLVQSTARTPREIH